MNKHGTGKFTDIHTQTDTQRERRRGGRKENKDHTSDQAQYCDEREDLLTILHNARSSSFFGSVCFLWPHPGNQNKNNNKRNTRDIS